MFNHPAASSVLVSNSDFTTDWMYYHTPSFDSTTRRHGYTTCYDDAQFRPAHPLRGWCVNVFGGVEMECLAGRHRTWARFIMTMSLAVGGSWPGNVANPAGYVGDLDVYSIGSTSSRRWQRQHQATPDLPAHRRDGGSSSFRLHPTTSSTPYLAALGGGRTATVERDERVTHQSLDAHSRTIPTSGEEDEMYTHQPQQADTTTSRSRRT